MIIKKKKKKEERRKGKRTKRVTEFIDFSFFICVLPPVGAFVFLNCLSFSNLPAIRNSARQKQTLSSALRALSRTASPPTTLSRWFVLSRTCNESTYTLPLFRRDPPYIPPPSPSLNPLRLHSKRCCSVHEQHVQ